MTDSGPGAPAPKSRGSGRVDVSKLVFLSVTVAGLLLGTFTLGMYSGHHRTAPFRLASSSTRYLKNALGATVKEAPALVRLRPTDFLRPARSKKNGVTVNKGTSDEDLILLSGFFQDSNEHRLIRRNGDIVRRWPVSFHAIFPNSEHLATPPTTDWNVDVHGVLLLPDGSLVFNFEYAGLVKLDRCGKLVWKLARDTHHSVEHSQRGGFWVPARRLRPKGSPSVPPYAPPYTEDLLLRVSDDGRVLQEISVLDLMHQNDLNAVITTNSSTPWPGHGGVAEVMHLNKIVELRVELASEFPLFEAGDLMLSERKRNLLLVVDPDTLRVKWWQIGPWLRQHDPEFLGGGRVLLFNNNVTYAAAQNAEKAGAPLRKGSNVMELHFDGTAPRVLYGEKSGQEMLSVHRGRVELLHAGNLLIAESEAGRVLEVTPHGELVWEFVNAYEPGWVARITEARAYRSDFFQVDDWACP